jgi:hypothetical protein
MSLKTTIHYFLTSGAHDMTQLWFSIVWLLNLNKNESMVIIFGSAVQLNDVDSFLFILPFFHG